jgi:hypothetical protein
MGLNKQYDFHRLRQGYNQFLRSERQANLKQSHKFLDELKAVDDKYPTFSRLPKNFRLLEKLSHLRGKWMTTQDLMEPFPFMEMGDLANRLVYYDKSMIRSEEFEMLDTYSAKKEPGPMESLEFARMIMGFQVHQDLWDFNPTELFQPILDNLPSSVSSR